MAWPTMSDYQEAIQSPHLCFSDGDLRASSPALTPLGLPRPITGGFASVYQLASNGRKWAVRCFLRDFKDQAERYDRIGSHLKGASLRYTLHFDYQSRGIRIHNDWYPILKMEWVEGIPLNTFVENTRHNPAVLLDLAQQWQAMLAELKRKDVAHGDLQHGNVLILPDGSIRLIDYDGMWVPALAGRGSHETGHPAYQNPKRTDRDHHRDIDDFAGSIITVGLLATLRQPELWDEFNNGDNLLFRKDDYLDPPSSRVFSALLALKDSDIKTRVRSLIRECGFDPDRVQVVEGVTASGASSWLADHVPGIRQQGTAPPPIFAFTFVIAWQRPGYATLQRVRQESVFTTKTRYRQEAVFETRVKYHSEPVFEKRTRIVRTTLPVTEKAIGKAFRTVFGLPQTKVVELTETYQVQVGTRQIPEPYQEQTGVRDVPDGTYQEHAGYRDVTETINVLQQGHNATVNAVAITRDGACVASGDELGIVILWKACGGERINTLQGLSFPITGLTSVGNGLIAASGGKCIRIWNVSGLETHTFTNDRNSYVNGVAATSEGRYVAAALGVLELYVWDMTSKHRIARLKAHKRRVLCAAFGSNHGLLVSGSDDMSVKVWDVRNQRCRFTLYGHTAAVKCVAVAPSDRLVASGGMDGHLILWDLATGNQAMRIPAHSEAVGGVAFTPDSRCVLTAGSDGTVRCWDVRTGRLIGERSAQLPTLCGLDMDAKGHRFVTCGNKAVSLWEPRTVRP